MEFLSSHRAFEDTIDSLKNEYRDDDSKRLVICGSNNFANTGRDVRYFRNAYPGYRIIAFNQEQLKAAQYRFITFPYYNFLKEADEVWDYDEENIKVLHNIRDEVKHHILKPYKKWPESSEKDIDILFYGCINEHRQKLLESLSKRYNVVIANNFVDNQYEDLDSYILRSRILLNIHFYNECSIQEQARMVRWLGAPCRIISEKSVHNYLGVEEMEYKDLFNI